MSNFEKQSIKIKGGSRLGAGRKKGIPNKRTAQVIKAVEDSGITPLDYLLFVMRDIGTAQRERLNAASMAAPYVHAKLSSIELNARVAVHEESLDDLA